jgi:hypothetical protein
MSMSLIWLRKQIPHLDSYRKCKDKYSPDRCSGYCLCGIALSDNGESKYCGSDLSKAYSRSKSRLKSQRHWATLGNL